MRVYYLKLQKYLFGSSIGTVLKIFMGSLFVAAASQISIPLPFVPITMQAWAVMIIGLFSRPKIAALILTTYFLEGICGLPVLAGFKSGVWPSTGYVIGFIPSAALIGYLSDKFSNSFLLRFFICLVGIVPTYMCGVSYLVAVVDLDFYRAISVGVLPVMTALPLKILLAISTVKLYQTYKAK